MSGCDGGGESVSGPCALIDLMMMISSSSSFSTPCCYYLTEQQFHDDERIVEQAQMPMLIVLEVMRFSMLVIMMSSLAHMM